jgi:hypothetical protein
MFRALTVEWSDRERAPLAWLAGILAITAAVYAAALTLSFVGDDFLILRLLERAGGLAGAGTYFRASFFGYYRPLAFLSHALDWSIWGERPLGYHLTSLVLHLANTGLLFLVARRMLGPLGAASAALLFALHPSNEEAVFWMSARFDLLATFFVMLGLWTRTRTNAVAPVAAALALALLSKESAFSFLLILALYDLVLCGMTGFAVVRRLGWLVLVAFAYTTLRATAGDPEAARGLAHFEKMLALAGGLAALLALAVLDWRTLLGRIAFPNRPWLAVAGGTVVAAAAALLPLTAVFVRAKLAFAAFVLFFLASPVIDLPGTPLSWDPAVAGFWVAGLVGLAAVGWLVLASRREIARSREALFAIGFTLAALLPVSSMTEGKRYLYLASIGVALLAGWIVDRPAGRARGAVAVAVPLILAISIWQVENKARDWAWAGRMTEGAIALVDGLRDGRCAGNDVVLLAAPVAVRDVYSHLYHDTFLRPGGCGPRSFRTLVRVVGHDIDLEAAWRDPQTIEMSIRGFRGSLVASGDLRHFDTPLRPGSPRSIGTPIGQLRFTPSADAGRVEVRLADPAAARHTDYLYFSRGAIRRLPAPGR